MNGIPFTRRDLLRGAALATATGCRSRDDRRDGITVLINSEPVHLDPRFPGDALGATISRLVFSGLLDGDPITFVPRLALAESLTQLDATTIRVRLRDGLRFHDGSVLSAHDVVATYQFILDASSGSTSHGTYARVFRSVRALDSSTVEFTLNGPDGTFPSLLQQPIVRARDAACGEILTNAGNESRFVGAGPMRVVSLETGAWQFERVEHLVGRANRVRFLTMHDTNTLALRLLHGDADLAEIKPELFPVFQSRAGFAVENARSVGLTYLTIRNDHPVLARREVRQAIAHAIDRHGLRTGKFGDFAVDATGPLPPSHWAYEGNVARYPFDPERARVLVASYARGERLVFRVSNVRFVVTAAHAIAEMLASVGIEVEIRQSDLASLLADLRGARFDLAMLTMPDLSDPWGLGWLLSTSSIPTASNPHAGGNRSRYSNPALDAALERGRESVGPEQRKPYYAEAQRIIAEDLPIVSLWHGDVVFAGGPRVSGWRPRGDGEWSFLLDVAVRG